jgi:hypothetical protein
MSDEALAIEDLTAAVQEQTQQIRVQNALLAVMAMNFERQHRENWELEFGDERKGYTWTRLAADIEDALYTFEEDLDR